MSRLIALFCVVWITVACGGGSPVGPTSPAEVATTPTPPSPAPAPPAPAPGFVYRYEESVTQADRQLIEGTLTYAQDYFARVFGRRVQGTITVTVTRQEACGGGSGTTFGATNGITLCVSNTGWTTVGATRNTTTVAHELFHVLQNQQGWRNDFWIHEGAAEYVGSAVAIDKGVVSYQATRDCQVWRYEINGRLLLPLSAINGSTTGAYGLAWLAWDRLLGGNSGVGKIAAQLAGSSFDSAYGVSLQAFEEDFMTYRRSLQTQSNSSVCNPLIS